MRRIPVTLLALLALLSLGCPGDDDDSASPSDDDTTAGDDDDDTLDDDDVTEQPPGCLAEPGPAPGPDICAEEAPCRWDGPGDDAKFGFAIDAGGDFDGDGVPDFAVGAKGYTEFDEEGQALLYPGIVTTEDEPPEPGRFTGTQPLAFAGFSVVLVQDMNGDGYDEMVVGATGVEEIEDVEDLPPNVGSAWLVYGGPLPAADPHTGEVVLEAATVFYGQSYYARVGWALASAGDVNGDGLGDLLLSGELEDYDAEVGATYRQGRVYLFFGRAEGFPPAVCVSEADVILDGDQEQSGSIPGEMAGASLAGGHDLDGDQVPDLLIGAPYSGSYSGRAYVVSGATVAAGGSFELADVGVILGEEAGAYDAFGWWVSSLGDITGDGLGDIAVGVPGHDEPMGNAGALVLYAGGTDLALGVAPEPMTTIEGEWDEHDFGIRAVGADVDGDGVRDLVASAIYAHQNFVGKAGRVYLFGGRDEPGWAEVTSATQSDADYTGAGVRDYMGFGLAASDLDGDGYDDLLMGSAYHDTASAEDQGRVYLFWGGGS